MKSKEIEVRLCRGGACFKDGFALERELKQKLPAVAIHGRRCMDHCDTPPNMQIVTNPSDNETVVDIYGAGKKSFFGRTGTSMATIIQKLTTGK